MPKISLRLAAAAVLLASSGTAIVLLGAPGLEHQLEPHESPHGILLGIHQYAVRCLAFAPNGKLLATGGGFWDAPGEIKLWDLAIGTEGVTLRGNQNGVYALAFAPDGRILATASLDQVVTLWDVATGQELASQPVCSLSSIAAALAPDGRTLALAGQSPDRGRVRLWRVASRTDQSLATGSGPLTFSADGRRLVLWHPAEGPQPADPEPATSESLISTSTLGELPAVQIWDLPIGREMCSLRGDRLFVRALAFSPDGRTLASGGFDDTVRLWDVASGRQRATLCGHTDQVGAVAFAPDGHLLGSGSHDGTVRLWDTATGEELATLCGHSGRVTSVAFAPDGQWIASGSHDRTVRLWPLANVR